jgi:hypothetical protein
MSPELDSLPCLYFDVMAFSCSRQEGQPSATAPHVNVYENDADLSTSGLLSLPHSGFAHRCKTCLNITFTDECKKPEGRDRRKDRE